MADFNIPARDFSARATAFSAIQPSDDMGENLEKMEANFNFSPSELVFVASAWKKDYITAGSWPQDAKPVTDEIYAKFIAVPPEGKVLSSDDQDNPCWVDKPEPTPEQLIAVAERKKDRLMSEAERVMGPLERAIKLDMATAEEKTRLTEWEKYSVLLNRINPGDAPKIDWPPKPE